VMLGAEPRQVALVQVSNEAWSTKFIASDATIDSTVRGAGCIALTGVVRAGVSAFVPDAALCAPAGPASITTINVTGDIRLTTDAVYRDARGNFNTVEIEELSPALTQESTQARLSRIENGAGKHTDLAFFASEPTQLTVRVFDSEGQQVGVEEILATAFTFVPLATRVEIGHLEITAGLPLLPQAPRSPVFALAFVARDEGGSPRVVYPRR
jgi:hypothetical protein